MKPNWWVVIIFTLVFLGYCAHKMSECPNWFNGGTCEGEL